MPDFGRPYTVEGLVDAWRRNVCDYADPADGDHGHTSCFYFGEAVRLAKEAESE